MHTKGHFKGKQLSFKVHVEKYLLLKISVILISLSCSSVSF